MTQRTIVLGLETHTERRFNITFTGNNCCAVALACLCVRACVRACTCKSKWNTDGVGELVGGWVGGWVVDEWVGKQYLVPE